MASTDAPRTSVFEVQRAVAPTPDNSATPTDKAESAASPTPTDRAESSRNALPSSEQGSFAKQEPQPEIGGTVSHSGVSEVAITDDESRVSIRGGVKRQKEKVEVSELEEIDEDDEDALLPEAEPTKPRREVQVGVDKLRENTIHVFGLDFLKEDHMTEIFSQFNYKYIEWIDDTCANVVFSDAANAKKGLESLTYPKIADEPWRRTPDILVNDDLPPVFLQLRYAVASDTKPQKKKLPPAPDFWGHWPRPPPRAFMPDPLAVAAKRKVPLSADELAKRRKRADRFGPANRTEEEPLLPKKPKVPVLQIDPPGEDELERRSKRAGRFSDPAEAGGEGPASGAADS